MKVMKTKNFFKNGMQAMIACLFAAVMTLSFSACSDYDNPVEPANQALTKQIQGQWIAINDFQGDDVKAYFDEEDFDDVEGIDPSIFDAHREVVYVNFDEFGNGSFLFFAVDSDNEPVGGEGDGLQLAMAFDYTVQPDGSIKITSKAPINGFEENDNFRFRYENGSLIADDGKQQFTLHRLSQAEDAQMTTWKIALGIGGASADNYNINDEDFTAENWRKQEAIYIFDGKGMDATDAKGRTGYKLVNLPWYDGEKQTNLPNGFCDRITPENGWEWVLNRCGSRNITNNNFFALYNKYTGILRFFYYMPENFATGNDHVWQVSMTDNLAQQSLWGYGLPSGETIKDRSKLAPTGAGTMTNYVTPWVDMKTDDGLIMPNAGWWAFDVDLSLYRPGMNIAEDAIKLQMRSWNISHVSLFSTMTASIDGSIKQKVKESESSSSSTSTAKGVMIGLKGVANIASSIAHFYKGDYGNAIGAIGDLFGCGSELAGLFDEEKKEEPFEGEISLGMNGTINTEGFIKDAVPTVGVSSPTIQMKDFNSNGNHVGQGVWNIKKFPKVYVVKDAKHEYTVNTGHPILEYFVSFPYFFDPRNIELQLNPEVFPDNEIEWVKADATCGVAAVTGIGGTDSHRTGFGLKSRNLGMSLEDIPTKNATGSSLENIMSQYGYPAAYDYLFYEKNKGNTSYPVKVCETGQKSNNSREYVIGRGIKNSHAIEPALIREIPPFSYSASYPIMVPDLEVNVTVIIKLKSMNEPVVLSRNYLPELEAITKAQLLNIRKEIYDNPTGSIYTYNREIYDYQANRIFNMYGLVDSFK